MEPFLGQIILFGGNFAPRGWAQCNGQLLPISQNSALFSILGTTYGGDGRTTFALPDLRGRAPIGWGNGPGLGPVELGEVGGAQTTTLTIPNLPSHNHPVTQSLQVAQGASSNGGDTDTPNPGAVPAAASGNAIYSHSTPDTTLLPAHATGTITVGVTGGNAPVSIQNPYVGMNYIIALEGIYPSRG